MLAPGQTVKWSAACGVEKAVLLGDCAVTELGRTRSRRPGEEVAAAYAATRGRRPRSRDRSN